MPRLHSFASLRRRLPHAQKCNTTGKKGPDHLPPEEILENMIPRRLYDPEPVSQAQLQSPWYSALKLIGWILLVVACTALMVLIATITKPLWQRFSIQTI